MIEQIGRLGCFGFMIINIPGTWFVLWIMSRTVLLIIASLLFAPSRIMIPYKMQNKA